MQPDFSSVPFADPARASANLSRMEQRLPARLLAALPTLLAPLPDPDGALNYLERFLQCDDAPALEDALNYMTRHPAALHYALMIFSYSRYLSETLVQRPDLVPWLHRPSKSRQFKRGIEHIKSQEDLAEDFARFAASPENLSPAVLLARFKRREYLRITLRDVLGLASLTETTLELSELADLLLARALHVANAALSAAYGTPQHIDARGDTAPAQLTIFSLGKLGARELNYSSDIDLLFLYTGDGETTGGSAGRISNPEYFIRVSHQVLKLISEVTSEGAVFRVDMRLRPRGTEGFLAVSIPSALDYYRSAAREWELQMLIKARPSAGDPEAGRKFLRELHPLIFKPQFNIAAVEAVLNARQEMTRSLTRRASRTALPSAAAASESAYDAQWNVKLTPGGIRDIEFLAQCLQRVYGGADPWLAGTVASATLVALQRLHDKGHLSGRDFFHLAGAYQFLRTVEHRLQLREGLQRHTLPDPATAPTGALDRLARRCGLEPTSRRRPGEELHQRIALHFSAVREIYQRILVTRRPVEPASSTGAQAGARSGESAVVSERLARDYPAVAAVVTAASGDPLARRGLQRYLSTAIHEPEVMAELSARPQTIHTAAALFSRSDFAVEVLSRQPADIFLPPGKSTQQAAYSTLAALRQDYRQQATRILFDSLLRENQADPGAQDFPFPALRGQSELAARALAGAVPLVAANAGEAALTRYSAPDGLADAPFVVLALGRLGTGEFDFGSDADLVFLADEHLTPQAREPWRRLTEKLIHAVSSHTREGLLFPVDTRLRPRGAEGEIVQSAAYLRAYLESEALPWEAISWLKALPLAGNIAFGKEVIAQAQTILVQRWGGDGAAFLQRDLAGLRARLEKEGTGPQSRTEFKHIAGGYFDIEYVLGLLFFRAAARSTSVGLFPGGANTLEQIAALESSGALPPGPAQTLRTAATFYRAVDHAHRLITGRPANRAPEPALGARIARLLAQWKALDSSAVTALDERLQSTRTSLRALYKDFFAQ